MIQNWEKRGLIYSGRAQIPTLWEVDKKTWRIYFADRTPDNKSFIRYIDVEAGNPKNILYEHKESILPYGRLGTFDHAGVMPSWVTWGYNLGEIYLYYIGWSCRKDVPYQNTIGLAISVDNGKTFNKYGEGPVLGVGSEEPFFTGTSCVINDTGDFRCWYLSCTDWVEGSPPEPRYNIKYRYSRNGIEWSLPREAVTYKNSAEGGICRASVVEDSGSYKMWYCYRGIKDYRTDKTQAYKIGYAENTNLARVWVRKDEEVYLPLSETGWDSEMLAYPFVLEHQGKYFMFYNGNGFGASGFGYATLPVSC